MEFRCNNPECPHSDDVGFEKQEFAILTQFKPSKVQKEALEKLKRSDQLSSSDSGLATEAIAAITCPECEWVICMPVKTAFKLDLDLNMEQRSPDWEI